MNEKLSIKNFGPIKDAIIDLKSALVLIGPQASGKSTIAKLVSILRDWHFINETKKFQVLLDDYNILSFLKEDTELLYESSSHTFRYLKGNESLAIDPQKEYVQLKAKFDELEKLNAAFTIEEKREILAKRLEELKALNEKLEAESNPKEKKKLDLAVTKGIEELDSEYQILKERFEAKVETLMAQVQLTSYAKYIPAERLLIAIYSDAALNFMDLKLPIPKNIIRFGSVFSNARNKINELKIPFLNFTYFRKNDKDFVRYGDDGYMTLKESSSGLQSLIPLLLVLQFMDDKEGVEELKNMSMSYVVEEPEQNLFPSAQKGLIYYLADLCLRLTTTGKAQSELIVTTHSPYTLTSFNNLLFAYRTGQKGKEHAEQVEKIIPRQSWISPDKFNAYYVADGTVVSIFNKETGLIAKNDLDSASQEIMDDFAAIMEIYKK
jgi:predicted ATPase